MPSAIAWTGSGDDREPGGHARGRGLELLTVLFDAHGPLEVGAVARALRTTRAAAYRQLRELQRLSFVEQDDDGRWRLPPGGVMTLSPALVARLNLRAAARPVIERLAARTGESVSVNALHRDHRIRIDAVRGRPPHPALPVGETFPLHSGTSGRVILAHLPRVTAAALVAGAGLQGEDHRRLRVELASVRRHGYLAAVGGWLPALASLSVPIFGSSGIAGAVTVSGPAGRWSREAMERAAAAVRIECATLSAALATMPSLD
jgi:IclR family transcriptional regulator, acetate operon repressor